MTPPSLRFDYVIVGAGSAGCVLANRLSADHSVRVALVEAGPGGRNPFVRMPRAWVTLGGERLWRYAVEDSPGRNGETWARGRGLGGSSAVNGMIYCRGQPEDYDSWAGFGVTGWGWAEMETAFRAIEDCGPGADPERGQDGPVQITSRTLDPRLEQAVFGAAESLGLERLRSLNGAGREGVGYYEHTVDRRGVRMSADRAFLEPARGRPNLTVLTRTQVERILFEDGRATGIAMRHAKQSVRITAAREVIVCAGAIESPQLLQVSGVGDGDALRRLGLPVIHDNAAVGRNLGEHVVLALPHRLKMLTGHNREFKPARLALNLAQYYVGRRGVLTYGASEVGGFIRSRPEVARPDLQLALSPYSFRSPAASGRPRPEARPGFTIIGYMLRPESRGWITLRSPNAGAPPLITPNWLSTPADELTAVAMMGHLRRFVSQTALAPFVGDEIWPGPDVSGFGPMLAALRGRFVSGLHAVGTCRMGADRVAVVDERLRVIGVQGLRVVDASVMPIPPSGNTNGPVMALAWRAADLINADRRGAS